MKVESIEIKNFKAISEENLQINGNSVYVFGRNAMGKTSFIDSIFKIISGKDLPPKPTKQGEKNGVVKIDMGDFVIIARFNEMNEKINLSIESKDGAIYKSPRTMLDDIAGTVDFDINEFFSLTPKKQTDFLKQITGIDFTDLDDEYNKVYAERTIVNRKVKDLEAQVKPYDKNKLAEIDISKIQKEIQEANFVNQKISEVKSRIIDREKEVSELEEKIIEIQKEIVSRKELNEKASEWLKVNNEVDIADKQKEFDEAIEFNKEVAVNVESKKLSDSLKKEIEAQNILNARIQEIETTKKRIVEESEMPVAGLSFDDKGLIYEGLPFDDAQINTAQKIIIGLQIQKAILGEIKIARFDGSLLDNENMEYVEDWAKKNDLQLFVEFVDRSAEALRIEIKEDVK